MDHETRALRLHLASDQMSERSVDRAAAMLYLSQLCDEVGPDQILAILEMTESFSVGIVLGWLRNYTAVREAVR